MPEPHDMRAVLAASGAVRGLRWTVGARGPQRRAACTCLKADALLTKVLDACRGTPMAPHEWLRRASRRARRGRLSMLLRAGVLCEAHGATHAAAFAGRVAALRVLCGDRPPAHGASAAAGDACAVGGNVCPVGGDACVLYGWAALGGRVGAMRWLRDPPRAGQRFARDSAALAGSTRVLRRLDPRTRWCPPLAAPTCETVALGGRVGALRWARRRGLRWGDCAAYAVACGSVRALRWALAHGCPSRPAQLCAHAACVGLVRTLRWLRARGHDWDAAVCVNAARHGHVDTLRWLRRRGAPCDVPVCNAAARSGHLHVLRWLRRRRRQPPHPWDASTCLSAAYGHRLEVLRWLRRQRPPCPWDARLCDRAIESGQGALLAWACDHGAPLSEAARRHVAEHRGGAETARVRLLLRTILALAGGLVLWAVAWFVVRF